jgi:hypothetical protein
MVQFFLSLLSPLLNDRTTITLKRTIETEREKEGERERKIANNSIIFFVYTRVQTKTTDDTYL